MKRWHWALGGLVVALVVTAFYVMIRPSGTPPAADALDARGLAVIARLRQTPPEAWIQSMKLKSYLPEMKVRELVYEFGPPGWDQRFKEFEEEWTRLTSLDPTMTAADPFLVLEPRLNAFIGRLHGTPYWLAALPPERQEAWRAAFEELRLPLANLKLLYPVMDAYPDALAISVMAGPSLQSIDTFDTSRPMFKSSEAPRTIEEVQIVSGTIDGKAARLFTYEGDGLKYVVVMPE